MSTPPPAAGPVIRADPGPRATASATDHGGAGLRAAAVIDAAAITASTRTLVRRAGSAAVMAVVKADGYGHGLLPSARAALAGGASWLGTATLDEAFALRAAGIDAPVLSWLAVPGEPLADAVRQGIDLSASAPWAVTEAVEAARAAGRPARVHLKVDTGLSRGGARPGSRGAGGGDGGLAEADDWGDLLDAAAKAVAGGELEVAGVWTHLVHADSPTHPTTDAQLAVFREAADEAGRRGLSGFLRHAANSAATLTRPDAHFDLVRPGLAVYGLSPVPDVASAAELGLQPAMTLTGRVALVKRVPADTGLSYGHRHTTDRETAIALVPLGYADGVPRAGTNTLEVLLGGRRRRVAGTVCMDQFVVEVGDDPVVAGDEVLLFGPGDRGEPTAEDWARLLGTISYEVITRVGARVPRVAAPARTGATP